MSDSERPASGHTVRSMRQQRVLDIAAERPDATMAEIADEIPSATVDLVEHVFDQYGDPAADDASSSVDDGSTDDTGSADKADNPDTPDAAPPSDNSEAASETENAQDAPASVDTETSTESGDVGETEPSVGSETASVTEASTPPSSNTGDHSVETETDATTATDSETEASEYPTLPDSEELTPAQRETLRTIHEYPEASQRELGAHLGVSGATVCRRIATIDGCEWDQRQEFIRKLLDTGQLSPRESPTNDDTQSSDVSDTEKSTTLVGQPADNDTDSSPSRDESLPSANGKVDQNENSEMEQITSDNSADSDDTDSQEGITDDEYPQLDELSKKHRKLVKAIAAQPDATQKELADQVDVARATVSRWVNDIKGFEWDDRESFVEAIFDEDAPVDVKTNGESSETAVTNTDHGDTADSSPNADGSPTERMRHIQARIKRLNKRVANLEQSHEGSRTGTDSVFDDPEFVHKIVHACIDSEKITESEELRILQELMK